MVGQALDVMTTKKVSIIQTALTQLPTSLSSTSASGSHLTLAETSETTPIPNNEDVISTTSERLRTTSAAVEAVLSKEETPEKEITNHKVIMTSPRTTPPKYVTSTLTILPTLMDTTASTEMFQTATIDKAIELPLTSTVASQKISIKPHYKIRPQTIENPQGAKDFHFSGAFLIKLYKKARWFEKL